MSKLFYHLIAHIIHVFRHRGSLLNSDGFTPNGGAEYTGWGEKIRRFWPISRSITETVRDMATSCYRTRTGSPTRAWLYSLKKSKEHGAGRVTKPTPLCSTSTVASQFAVTATNQKEDYVHYWKR